MTNATDQTLPRVASMRFADYDPPKVIEAVNELRALGKDGALQQVDGYLESHRGDDSYGLFWVLRVLFDVPPAPGFPPVSLGQPSIPPPSDPATLPRFPIVIVRDVPLLVVDGYSLGGLPEGVENHVGLLPGARDDPRGAAVPPDLDRRARGRVPRPLAGGVRRDPHG